jgi:hypothetical protein
MVDLKILKEMGCTSDRLREIFTSEEGGKDYKIKERLQSLIESRIHEGVMFSARHANLYMSVDLAWDSLPINKATIPLLQYAQGKVDIQGTHDALEDLDCAKDFCEYDEENALKSINVMRLYEVSMNLIRSYVTRRVAAQVSRYNNLFPYLKYDSRGTGTSDKVRGDVLSQRVEIMADQFGYRHFFAQSIRDMFLYGKSISFPSEAWTREVSWRYAADPVTGKEEKESYVEREGVSFVKPHPTRIFWDQSSPLPQINDNTGPDWIGYWDIVKYSDMHKNPAYWNTDKIEYTNNLIGLFDQNKGFFSYYFDSSSLTFPKLKDNFAFKNERVANIGIYSADERDKGMFLSNLFIKINPKAEGIGDYPFDVWLRLVVASDSTVLHAEFMPSIPAIYGGINENDDRLANISIAHEIMPFQDQMNNIMTTMLHHMKVGMMKIIAIDQDALDPEMRDYITDQLREDTFYGKPRAFLYSGTKAADLGLNATDFISVIDVQKELAGGIQQSIGAVLQLLTLVERLLILSPQELGQPSPREISATEVTEIASTTNALYAFISDGIDDQRGAIKKMLYEHLVSCSSEPFRVPARGRYTVKAVQDAGFDVEDIGDLAELPRRRNVMGTPISLVHEYMFTSRDGAERARDVQSAQVLGQLLQQLMQSPELAQSVGKERIFDMLNEIFRMSGAGYDLLLEVDEAEDQQAQQGIQQEQFMQTLQKELPNLVELVQNLNQRVGTIESVAGMEKENPQAPPPVASHQPENKPAK